MQSRQKAWLQSRRAVSVNMEKQMVHLKRSPMLVKFKANSLMTINLGRAASAGASAAAVAAVSVVSVAPAGDDFGMFFGCFVVTCESVICGFLCLWTSMATRCS